MRHVLLGAVVLSLLGAAGHLARAEEEGLEKVVPRSLEELDAKIREVLAKRKTPAVVYALFGRDGVKAATGIGKADVASGREATGDTLFRIGSISKMFVGLSALMLQEEGRLSLDDTMRSRAPEIAFENPWEATDPVRLVHLLEHTAGFDDLTLREYAHNRLVTLKEGLEYEPRSRRSRWRPGTRMSYCNSGPPMVAYAIEKVTGRRFEDFVAERLFAPLAMATATYFKPEPAQAATLYHPDGTTPYPYWEIMVRPSGSINASAAELAHLGVMLLNRGRYEGRELLPPAAIDRLERPTTTYAARAGVTAGYALGNYASFEGGFELHGHDGGVDGGLARLAYLKDAGVGFVAMINSGNGDAAQDLSHLLRNYLTRDLPKPASAPTVPVPASVATAFTGWYMPDSPRQEMLRFLERLLGLARVRLDGDRLTVRPLLGAARTFLAEGPTTFRRDDRPAATLALLETPEGRLLQSDSTARQVSTLSAWLQIGLAALAVLLMLSAPLFALVWVPRWLLGRLKGAPHLAARAFPLAAVLSLAAAFSLFVASDDDLISRFGNPTRWSVGFCALTVVFALAAVLGLWRALRVPAGEGNRWARVHAILVAGANTAAAAYLFYWGIIGMRTWT